MNRPKGGWIPLVWRKSKGPEEDGAPEEAMIACCDMPMPGDEILTSANGCVWADTVLEDDEGYYLDSGLYWQDVDAWMPMPQPYRADEEKHNS